MKPDALWTHSEIQEALSCASLSSSWIATGVSIDSRTLEKGDIFVALVGDAGDGHDYAKDAALKGAAALIVHKDMDASSLNCPVIRVENTLEALNALGRYRRQQCPGKMIALTGSVGKTTTKQFFADVCQSFGKTAYSEASFNNQWGVPLTLARMPRDAEFGIFEIGMNHPGEIEPLAKMVRPHLAMITLIGDAHIGNMGSHEAIAREKAYVFSGFDSKGVAVLNRDDPYYDLLGALAQQQGAQTIVSFGRGEGATVRLKKLESSPQRQEMTITFELNGQTHDFKLPFLGEHRAMNALGVIAALDALGLSVPQVCKSLSNMKLIKGRGAIHQLQLKEGVLTLIDDAYNANPTSMRAALSVLATLPKGPQNRRVVVFGEMGELGDYAEASHRELASYVKEADVDLAFSCGPNMRFFYENLPDSCQGGFGEKVEDIQPLVEQKLQPGDIVLVKGSKYTRVITIVDRLLKQLKPAEKVL